MGPLGPARPGTVRIGAQGWLLRSGFSKLQLHHRQQVLHRHTATVVLTTRGNDPAVSWSLGGCRTEGRLVLDRQQQQISQRQQRSIASFRRAMRRVQWPLMRSEMCDFFEKQLRGPARSLEQLQEQREQTNGNVVSFWRSSSVDVECRPWERFISAQQIQGEGFIPAIVNGKGIYRKCAIPAAAIHELAFEEAEGHLSLLFKARLFRLHIGPITEECVVTQVKADPLARRLYFVGFERHVPGSVTEVQLPLTLVGLLACPAYHQGCHVELARPTVPVQFVGAEPPPPFLVDVSQLQFSPPYSAVTIDCLIEQLPSDGTARFPPSLNPKEEVAWAYEIGTLPEAHLPSDWRDPNFVDRRGNMMDVWYHRKFPRPT